MAPKTVTLEQDPGDELPEDQASGEEAEGQRQEDQLVAVEDGAVEGEIQTEEESPEDERLGARTGGAVDQEREQRRQTRRQRRQRQREARNATQEQNEMLRQQNAEIRAQNEEIMRRLGGVEGQIGSVSVATIDGRLNEYATIYNAAEAQLAEAAQKGDGPGMVAALRARDEARQQWNELRGERQRMTAASTDTRPQQQRGLPESVMQRVRQFSRDNPWYDWRKPFANQDSRIIHAIDAQVMTDGFNPETDEYWEELEDRAREALPHRFGEGEAEEGEERPRPRQRGNGHQVNGQRPQARPRRGGPPVGGGDGERPLAANEVLITPERKKAMVEAGSWDDPKKRQRMLKAYREYDRQNARAS